MQVSETCRPGSSPGLRTSGGTMAWYWWVLAWAIAVMVALRAFAVADRGEDDA